MSTEYARRLTALRKELIRRALDGFVVPTADSHLSEYVDASAQRLSWLTGFRGSAGWAAVLTAQAAIFVDGRYTLQVREQVDERYWSFQPLPPTNIGTWLCDHAVAGMRVGYDPWLHTKGWVQATSRALAEKRVEFLPVARNPVDEVWAGRPAKPTAKLVSHPDEFTGSSSAAKRRQIADWLASVGAQTVVLTALDSIAWTFNVRGDDIPRTPVALAFALIHADGTGDLFVASEKLTDEVLAHLGAGVRVHPYEAFGDFLSSLGKFTFAVDPERTVCAVFSALGQAGAQVLGVRDPVVLAKAVKNETEIAGHRAAQRRDGAALARFLHWFATKAPTSTLSEVSAATRLLQFRQATGKLRDLAFDTISAFGKNGAIVHYSPTRESDQRIVPGSLYLVDSGGQYADGTTDVTRTVGVGAASDEMRDRFTRVLKGHIALARAIFPKGTRGIQLDILARQYLWREGLDYAHGTGHGLGAYLCVHEGPQLIHSSLRADEPLLPGMIVSNEPGYYKRGEYGIRIENLMLVVERQLGDTGRTVLGFETLTLAPIDQTLIEPAMLTTDEVAWLDAYHARVAQDIGPQLDGAALAWVTEVTRPLNPAGSQCR